VRRPGLEPGALRASGESRTRTFAFRRRGLCPVKLQRHSQAVAGECEPGGSLSRQPHTWRSPLKLLALRRRCAVRLRQRRAVPPAGFEPAVLGLKVQSVDLCATEGCGRPAGIRTQASFAYKTSAVTRLGHRPVGRLRIERSSIALSGRCQQPAGLHPLCGRQRSRSPAVARTARFPPGASVPLASSSASGERSSRSPRREARSR
jgi:hypothetical protein